MSTHVLWLEYIQVHITRPADTLQVPRLVVQSMILLLPLRYDPHGEPFTFMRRYLYRGPEALAAKLAIDRDVIIDATISCDRKREELKEKLRKSQEIYFSSLNGPHDYELSAAGRSYVRDWSDCKNRIDNLLPPKLETRRIRCIARVRYAIYMCVPRWLVW
ncbi:hypothetical protein AOQ84DRAFT_11365 [Glonium stellatum]|uniref:Uncharacterized protein n=1 Tax=Glonium stellatum TaxID=574774 RepID=A0A8E2JUE2_9PEZI|nr:hypothetical protein AOQ84DRAFT_11365 [Glonium stellatum]